MIERNFSEKELNDVLPNLYKYATYLTRDIDKANDLVQDVLIRALDKHHLFAKGTDLKYWLVRIMHGISVDHIRSSIREGIHLNIEDFINELQSKPTAFDRIMFIEVYNCIQVMEKESLRKKYQADVIRLVMEDELTNDEMAEKLNIPVGTVRSRIHRGRQYLKEAIGYGLSEN